MVFNVVAGECHANNISLYIYRPAYRAQFNEK